MGLQPRPGAGDDCLAGDDFATIGAADSIGVGLNTRMPRSSLVALIPLALSLVNLISFLPRACDLRRRCGRSE